MRVPRIGRRDASASAPTLAEVAERWRASRVDVTEGTAVGHRVQLARVLRVLGTRPVDEITPADVAALVTALHEAGRKRETIRKSLTVLAQVLDFAGIKDNPARDRIHVRLPRQEREEPNPPTAGQIEAVLPLMPRLYALAVLVLDATAMRVGELEEKGLRCGDLDEPNTRWRVRRAVEKSRRGRWVSLPPDLFAAVVGTLPPREDRVPDRPVFSWVDTRATADGDSPRLQSVGHADVVPARPAPPPHQPLAPTRRNLGSDRRPRRAAVTVGHGGHLHSRPSRRSRTRARPSPRRPPGRGSLISRGQARGRRRSPR